MIKRYDHDYTIHTRTCMIEERDGEWVVYSDYAALEAELEKYKIALNISVYTKFRFEPELHSTEPGGVEAVISKHLAEASRRIAERKSK